jgi:sporulation protein YlmC with PRC-barrel domain
MISKYLGSALVIVALGSGVAVAQTATRTDATASAAAHREGAWRASKLVGVDVYNEGNEKISDISEIILDKSGKVANVIIGVGGFLGMGEHYVAVAYDKLKWVNEPVRSASTASAGLLPARRRAWTATPERHPTVVCRRRPARLPVQRVTPTGIPITWSSMPPRISSRRCRSSSIEWNGPTQAVGPFHFDRLNGS